MELLFIFTIIFSIAFAMVGSVVLDYVEKIKNERRQHIELKAQEKAEIKVSQKRYKPVA